MLSKRKKQGILIAVCCIAVLLAMLAAAVYTVAGENRGGRISPDEVISNNDEVIASIRNGLQGHSSRITVAFVYDRDILLELPRFVDEWMEAAMEETGSPIEGDYIRYQCGGYESSSNYDRSGGGYAYIVQITPNYYMYLVQEEAVTEKLDEIFDSFGFDDGTSDYEKIRTIYDYICSRVRYDKIHVKNKYYCLRSTAYAALVQETATCQGYCVALYRMLRQAGVSTRIITGTGYGNGSDSFHAWNIVELDGVYYNLDATWDAGKETYSYFLRGSDGFADHVPGEEFCTEAFVEQYPISDADCAFP